MAANLRQQPLPPPPSIHTLVSQTQEASHLAQGHNGFLLGCASPSAEDLLRLFLVPRMMITASWPSKVFFTSPLLRTSPTTTLEALWSAGSLVGSRTSTVTLYPRGEMEQLNRNAKQCKLRPKRFCIK